MSCPFVPSRMAIMKKEKQKITSAGEVEKLEPLCMAGGNVKWCSFLETVEWFLKH